jgi:hypothetical protein
MPLMFRNQGLYFMESEQVSIGRARDRVGTPRILQVHPALDADHVDQGEAQEVRPSRECQSQCWLFGHCIESSAPSRRLLDSPPQRRRDGELRKDNHMRALTLC